MRWDKNRWFSSSSDPVSLVHVYVYVYIHVVYVYMCATVFTYYIYIQEKGTTSENRFTILGPRIFTWLNLIYTNADLNI